VTKKNTIFCSVTPCSMVEVDRYFGETYSLRDVGKLLPDYTAWHPRVSLFFDVVYVRHTTKINNLSLVIVDYFRTSRLTILCSTIHADDQICEEQKRTYITHTLTDIVSPLSLLPMSTDKEGRLSADIQRSFQ
jgi:hypothetical protein